MVPAAEQRLEPRLKPRLRGVSHQFAFYVAVVAGGTLVGTAPDARSRLALGVYAVSLAAMFGVSALYHRVSWTVGARRLMRRLDHAMILVLIAGTYTPFALLVFSPALGSLVLVLVWGATAAGIGLALGFVDAPKPLLAAVPVALGWVAAATMPSLFSGAGTTVGLLVIGGGALYTAGAIVYALRRPDPRPAVFGYHEVFHLLVIAAAAAQFVAVAAAASSPRR